MALSETLDSEPPFLHLQSKASWMAVRIKCGWKMAWNHGLGAGPEAMLTNGSKERSQRLLKMPPGGVYTFLLITNKIILFIVRKRTRRTFTKSVSQWSALSMGYLRNFFFLNILGGLPSWSSG